MDKKRAKELIPFPLSLLPGFLILPQAHSLNVVLGPLLFSVSFHSLDHVNHSHDFRYHLYADNSLKYISSFRYINMPGAAPVIKHINIFIVKYGINENYNYPPINSNQVLLPK